tara:strand:- start:2021 stop:2161 length:141 start_codon:yes stop_codon:yes gene_type:complete
MEDLKLYMLNASSLALSFTDWIEPILKVLLLSITIGYTIHKWWKIK